MTTDTSRSVFRSAVHFFSGTLFSRLSGMIRDIAMAFYFGTSPVLAGFMLAYRFAYLMRRLFGESILHQGFIPHFESIRVQDPVKGSIFFRDLFWTVCLLLFGIVLALEGGLEMICRTELLSNDIREIVRLSMWILPGVFFICLFGLCSGLLQSLGYFLLSSISPVAFNLVWIFGVFILRNLVIEKAVTGLALILSLAFFVQWAITTPILWKYLRTFLSSKECFSPTLFSKNLKALFKPLFLGVLGVASVQINSAIDGIFARFSSLEGPAYLWYAIRIQQLPLALFGIALSSALLPSLSRAFQENDQRKFFSLIQFAKQRTFSLIFPCVVGIFALGFTSVNLLFGRGDFSSDATMQTTKCLWGYGFGLLPYAFVQVLATIFYAKKNYHLPAKGFIYSTLINIFLNTLLIFYLHFGPASVAFSTSLAAIFNVGFLLYHLNEKKDWDLVFLKGIAKTTFCGLVAGVSVIVFSHYFLQDPTWNLWLGKIPSQWPRNFSIQVIHFCSQAGVFFCIFFSSCILIRNRDVLECVTELRSK